MTEPSCERFGLSSMSEALSRSYDIEAMERIAEAYKAAEAVEECLGCDENGKITVTLAGDDEYSIPCPLMILKCEHGARMRGEIDVKAMDCVKDMPGVPYAFRAHQDPMRSTAAMRGAAIWAYENYPFLVLHGAHGTGKSFAAAYAVYVVQRERLLKNWKYRPAWSTLPGLWVSAYRVTTKEEAYEAARVIPILVIDDLGSEENTPRIKTKLLEIVSERHKQRRLTIITMCDDVVDLPKLYSVRMAERILGAGHTVYCGGESLRLAG